jgi:hypothetical protein
METSGPVQACIGIALLFTNRNVQYIGLYAKYPLFLLALNVAESSRKMLEKSSDIKFNQNPSRGNRVFFMRTEGRTDGHTGRHGGGNSPF